MFKRPILLIALFVALAVPALFAGDGATFVDLGFSPDGKTYMFAQYGVESASLKPWAELYVVDVKKNDFVAGGVKKAVYPEAISPGQDGSGAFHRLLADNSKLLGKNGIDALRQGTPLYVALDSAADKNGSALEFRDFDKERTYKATLNSLVSGEGAALKSSFFIVLDRTEKDGSSKRYNIGTPGLKRPGVVSYAVRRVVEAPKDGSLIFVVEQRKQSAKGVDLRYMVEALRP